MRRISIISMLVLLIFLLPTIGSLAQGAPAKVILVSPSGRIDELKPANIEVHVLEKGQYVKPDIVQAFDYDDKEISLTEKSTGIWTGSLNAKDEDIRANCEVGSNSDETALGLRINEKATVAPFSISLEPKDEKSLVAPKGGDNIGFYVKVYHDGVLSDDSTLEVSYFTNGMTDTQKLAATKVSTGIYEATFSVPPGTESKVYDIRAQIKTGTYSWISTSEDVVVNFFQVWFHKQTISTTTATFDIYVSDLNGKAVSGASIKLNYSFSQTDNWVVQTKEGGQATTDNKGKSSYTITYSKVDHTVTLTGTVVANGQTQHFSGDVVITPRSTTNTGQPPEPMPWGLDVVYQGNPETILKPSKSASLQFKAYYGSLWPYVPSAPLASKDIYYYVYTYQQVVAYGKITTDANGLFTLSVSVPAIQDEFDVIMLDFEYEVSTNDWEEDTEGIAVSEFSIDDYMSNPEKLKDNNLQVSVDKLRVGGTSKVTAKFSGATDSTTAFVQWVPAKVNIGDLMTWSDTQPEWEQLNGGNAPSMAKKGKDYSTNIIIPEFMPKGTYTIFVVMLVPEDFNTENPFKAYHVNYLQVQAGQGGTVGGDTSLFGLGKAGGVDVGIILILVLVIVIVVIVIVVLMARKKPTAAPPGAYPPGQYPPPAAQAAPPPGQQQQVPIAHPIEHAGHDHAGHTHPHPHPHEAAPAPAPMVAPAPATPVPEPEQVPAPQGGPVQPSQPYDAYQAPPPPPQPPAQ